MPEPAVVSAIAGSVSVTVAAVAAGFSAWSSRTAWLSLREGRRRYAVDHERATLGRLGEVYDAVEAFWSSVNEASGLVKVQQSAASLNRAVLVSGEDLPACQHLVDLAMRNAHRFEGVSAHEVAAARAELQAAAHAVTARIQELDATHSGTTD